MKIGHAIDAQGFFVCDVVEGSGIIPDVTALCPDGFYRPKWNGVQWIEGMAQSEIDAIMNTPQPPLLEEQVKQMQEVINMLMMEGL